ncbi:hypothetical protein [Anaerocolumna chitinilytica]|uniref:Replication terminator protein n=1 Tax=Anaerocolumna chitinilytica TaxID=1727145 RepID=A0A7I8DL89_9FIRM|nr:hypothetical protein [Anaerocolumna chitinilytica]BCJ98084.1 hypothetical protein bsdcttw_11250 [Anaerocolumna chitinilytica]
MEKINLEDFAGGALAEKINQALREVTENVQDPNTKATAKRKITCTFTFSPSEQRDLVATSIDVKSTLAPSMGIATAFVMGKDITTNEVDYREYSKQVKGQMNIQDIKTESEQAHEFTGSDRQKKGYDQSTGEFFDTEEPEVLEPNNKVVDLRAAR